MIPFKPQRALISVSNKEGIVELAKALHQNGVELIATGNTAQLLKKNRLPVTEVSQCTGFPEIMDGRVKTLHPAIHGGLLARGAQDAKTLAEHHIKPFDLLIVNLYPFEQVISNPDCDFATAIENIDIGGPTMIRAAAKNHQHVLVVVSPNDYAEVITAVKKKQIASNSHFEMAKKAFAHTAAYDGAIANYLGTLNDKGKPCGFPATLTCQFNKKIDLRYGENPHQQAIFYSDKTPVEGSLAEAQMIQGKALSYNNLLDADGAFDCIKAFSPETPVCAIIKHGNPCGIASADTQMLSYLNAFQCDPQSSFGGIIAFNQCLQADTAETVVKKQFAEVIIAPAISEAARTILSSKPNIRVLITGQISENPTFKLDMRRIDGGLLVQEHDNFPVSSEEFKVVTKKQPTEQQQQDLHFAWLAAKYVKSNAIVIADKAATIGIGAGQPSRIMSTRVALWQAKQAGFSCKGAVLASDAFFPFADSLDLIAEAGISAIIQPGGSIRDQEVIDAADRYGISMIFTGFRHFRH